MSLLLREYRRGLRGQPCFKPLLGATSSEMLSPSMRRYRAASCVHGLNDISQIPRSLLFLQVSPKLLSWNTVVGSKEVQESSVYLPFFLFSSRENVAKNKEGLVGVPCGAETNLRVWYLMFSKSPVCQQVPTTFAKSLSIHPLIASKR